MEDPDRRWRDFYNRTAWVYDRALSVMGWARGFSDRQSRLHLIGRLHLQPGYRVLEVSVGTGSNLLLMAGQVGPKGQLVGLDISPGMLEQSRRKLVRQGLTPLLVEGDAVHLPFASESFDAVLHFGSFNTFSNRQLAASEMLRVAKPGARIVISAEGLRPDRRSTWMGRLMVRVNPLYQFHPPIEFLPPEVQDLNLIWYRGALCYLVDFSKPA